MLPRNGRGPRPSTDRSSFRSRCRQFRLPNVFQSSPAAYHPFVWIRTTSSQSQSRAKECLYSQSQGNFFRHIGTILTFAFAGTFISAVVLGLILFVWTRMALDGFKINFVEAMSVGATLSATDPVTILAIFNTYKVEPKLYTIIFGESILNDAIAIVLFETAQKYKDGAESLGFLSLFEAIGIFFGVFFGSLFIGVMVGIGASLMLKFTYVRRMPKTESCLIILIAYLTYFLSNAIHMSGRFFPRYARERLN